MSANPSPFMKGAIRETMAMGMILVERMARKMMPMKATTITTTRITAMENKVKSFVRMPPPPFFFMSIARVTVVLTCM